MVEPRFDEVLDEKAKMSSLADTATKERATEGKASFVPF
jgi:hypothetical protein